MPESTITLRVDDATGARLRELADATGKSLSKIVREALEAYLRESDRELACFDLAERSGVIGCVRDAPPDLSTNPKRFEGFRRE